MSPVPVPARLPVEVPVAVPERLRSPAPAPDPQRLRPGVPKPRLRLVDNRRLEQAKRRRRARRLVVAAAVLAVASLIALAGTHAMLVSNQVRLDALEQQAAEAQARHQALRLEVATLEDPARVVSVASERLGMVPPETIIYLEPVDVAQGDSPPPAPESSEIPSPALSWGAVKSHLAGQ